MPSSQIRNREMKKNGNMKGCSIPYLCEVFALPPLQPASSGHEWRIMASRYRGQVEIH